MNWAGECEPATELITHDGTVQPPSLHTPKNVLCIRKLWMHPNVEFARIPFCLFESGGLHKGSLVLVFRAPLRNP